MVIVKGNRPRISILPLVIVVTALIVLVRYSSLTLHRVEVDVDRAETNERDIPRVFVDEKPQVLPEKDASSENERNVEDENVEEERKKQLEMEPPSKPIRFCDKQDDNDKGICIFDIGLNNGQDTMQYLEHSADARVVAVEANPTLVDEATNRFGDAIAASRLKLLNIGLVGNKTEGEESPKLEFWINKVNDVFSSFHKRTGCRNKVGIFMEEGDTTFCRKIEMQTKSCSELVKEYGTPLYMKIDIEGMDRKCLQSLGNIPQEKRPKYASIENVDVHDINIFTWLGYRGFKVVNQNSLQLNLTSKAMEGHSGPWGEDAQDFWIGNGWHTREELLNQLPLPASILVGGSKVKGWLCGHDGTQAGFKVSECRAKPASEELTPAGVFFGRLNDRSLALIATIVKAHDALCTVAKYLSLKPKGVSYDEIDLRLTKPWGNDCVLRVRKEIHSLECLKERGFIERAVTQPYLG